MLERYGLGNVCKVVDMIRYEFFRHEHCNHISVKFVLGFGQKHPYSDNMN